MFPERGEREKVGGLTEGGGKRPTRATKRTVVKKKLCSRYLGGKKKGREEGRTKKKE